MTKINSCQECLDYQTEVCNHCPHTYHHIGKSHSCPVCGGHMVGDGYTTLYRCENVDYPIDTEPDSGPYYCKVPDGVYGAGDKIPF